MDVILDRGSTPLTSINKKDSLRVLFFYVIIRPNRLKPKNPPPETCNLSMMIRVILHDHLDAVELFGEKHTRMVVGKRQRRKRKEQVGGLFQILVDTVRRPDQKHDIPRKTVAQGVRQLDGVHQLAFFRQNNALVFGFREFLVKKGRFLRQRLYAVVYLGFLEFHDFERKHSPTQTLDVLVDLVGNERRTRLTKNS